MQENTTRPADSLYFQLWDYNSLIFQTIIGNNHTTYYITPENIQRKYALPTNEIRAQHITDLINHQKNLDFLLAPSLTEKDLLPDHFQKMKVKTTTNVINHDVASGLKFIAEELNKPEYITTAWYNNEMVPLYDVKTSKLCSK